jgi:hypothetical protein
VAVEETEPAAPPPPGGASVAERPLPGSADLDRALDALRRGASVPGRSEPDEWPPAEDEPEPPPITPRRMASIEPPSIPPRPAPPPIVSPAGRAYRRLRRIFPG